MKHRGILKNIILIILCILLAGGLGYFLLQYRQEERSVSEQIRQDAESVREQERRITPKPIPVEETEAKSGDAEETEAEPAVEAVSVSEIETTAEVSAEETPDKNENNAVSDSVEDTETVSEAKTESEVQAESEAAMESEAKAENEAKAESEDKTEAESESQVTPAAEITMISCRGDAWQQGEDSDRTIGWPAKLQTILDGQHAGITVFDGTWDMSGSLSQMSYAGVPLSEVSGFIRGHQEAGLSEVRTEMRVRRDLQRKIVERTDYNAVPVITIGYNGGFGRNLEELVEQQKLILETYHIPQLPEVDAQPADDGEQGIAGCYLILGRYPEGWADPAAYDDAMIKAWGDHYVSLNALGGDVFSDEFRQGVANVVYEQMKEKGYLPG